MVKIPFLNKLRKPQEKIEIEKQIKQLNKEKAELKSSKKELEEMDRDTSDIDEELQEIEKKLKKRYDELANLEYKQALNEIGEKSKEKKVTLSRMKGELKEERKKRRRLETKLEELEEKKESLKEDKKDLAKKINELEEKVRDKEMKIQQKEDIIQGLKEEPEKEEKPQEEPEQSEEEKSGREKILESLLKDYSSYIEEKEKKTIQEMKEMVQPNNINLREFLEDIEKDGLEACEEAYDKIMDKIESCSPLPVEYWMNIKTMIDLKAAGHKDKAILLCSAFRHFGAESHVAIIKLENGERRPLTQIKTNNKYLLIDPNQKQPFKRYYGTRGEIKNQYKYKGSKIREFKYLFNDREYITYEET